MVNLGDYFQDKTVRVFFDTKVGGVRTAPNSALETADIKIYKNGSAAQKTTTNGLTMTSPFDGIVGFHLLEIDTSNDTGDGGFWTTASDYCVVLDADETLGGVALGGIPAFFSIENRSGLRPTVADRTLAVDASGRVDVGQVVGTSQTAGDIIADTNDIQARLPAALVSGRMDSSVGAMAANVMTAAAAAADLTTELQSGLATAASLSSLDTKIGTPAGASVSVDIAGVQSDTNDLQTRLPAALVSGRIDASVGAMATDTLTSTALAASAVTEIQSGLSTLTQADIRSAVGLASANLDTQLSTIAGFIDTEVAAIISAIAALNNISTAQVLAQVEAALTATIADSVPADGSRPSISSGVYMIAQFLLERAVSGTTVTVKKPDGASTLMTFTLDSATVPTSITRAS